MEDSEKLIETLLERTADYTKTSFELIKLKTADKILEVVSSLVPSSVICIMIAFVLLFFSLGMSFWLGEVLGKTSYGFFLVAALYGFISIVVRFLLYNWLKKLVGNYIIKKIFN
jgi:hypothetical protein